MFFLGNYLPLCYFTLFNARQFYLSRESHWMGKSEMDLSAHLSSLTLHLLDWPKPLFPFRPLFYTSHSSDCSNTVLNCKRGTQCWNCGEIILFQFVYRSIHCCHSFPIFYFRQSVLTTIQLLTQLLVVVSPNFTSSQNDMQIKPKKGLGSCVLPYILVIYSYYNW